MTKKHRSEHRIKPNGQCGRCGMIERDPYCPPGYWMTAAEAMRWDSMNAADREAFEVSLGRAPT